MQAKKMCKKYAAPSVYLDTRLSYEDHHYVFITKIKRSRPY